MTTQKFRTMDVLDMNAAHTFIFDKPKGGGDGTKRMEKFIKLGMLQPLTKRCDSGEVRRYFLLSDLKSAKGKILTYMKNEILAEEKVNWKAKYHELLRSHNPKNFALT